MKETRESLGSHYNDRQSAFSEELMKLSTSYTHVTFHVSRQNLFCYCINELGFNKQ